MCHSECCEESDPVRAVRPEPVEGTCRGSTVLCAAVVLACRDPIPLLRGDQGVCHSRAGGNPGSIPRQKPLDTDRDKGLLIEDIVVDNPWEGATPTNSKLGVEWGR